MANGTQGLIFALSMWHTHHDVMFRMDMPGQSLLVILKQSVGLPHVSHFTSFARYTLMEDNIQSIVMSQDN